MFMRTTCVRSCFIASAREGKDARRRSRASQLLMLKTLRHLLCVADFTHHVDKVFPTETPTPPNNALALTKVHTTESPQ